MIFASQGDKLFVFADKNQTVCQSVIIIKEDLEYQFSLKVTHSKLWMCQKIDSFTVCWHFQVIFVSQSLCLLTLSDKSQKFAKVLKWSEKTQGTSLFF
jgi:hypothetical protein